MVQDTHLARIFLLVPLSLRLDLHMDDMIRTRMTMFNDAAPTFPPSEAFIPRNITRQRTQPWNHDPLMKIGRPEGIIIPSRHGHKEPHSRMATQNWASCCSIDVLHVIQTATLSRTSHLTLLTRKPRHTRGLDLDACFLAFSFFSFALVLVLRSLARFPSNWHASLALHPAWDRPNGLESFA